jgi:hypothetical protein
MKHRKRQGVLLGLLAALSLLAFSASAQALTPKFVYKNKAGTEVAFLLAKITAKQLGRGTLSIPGLNAEINCEKLTTSSGAVETAIHIEINILWEECTALSISPLVELEGCEVVTPEHETTGGTPHHITIKILIGATELNNGEPALLGQKIESKIVFRKEVGCVLPVLTTLKGEVCLKVDKNDTVEPELLASQTIQGECRERTALEGAIEGAGFKDKLLYGAQEMFLTAKADLRLIGEHEGFKLGVFLK